MSIGTVTITTTTVESLLMNVTAVIQARLGSTRLPGKVMYPLDGQPALGHVITRATHAESVTNVVVATSIEPHDDVVKICSQEYGASIIRGSESDVMERYESAIEDFESDIVVRITGDCPLISPDVIDSVVGTTISTDVDYSANVLERTFPRGLDVECFTSESFQKICQEATESHHREHVTPYYRENPDRFTLASVTASEVFEESWLQDRSELRLTLDEAPDYDLLRRIYSSIPYQTILPVRDAIQYVDENNLTTINESVKQKETKCTS